MISLQWDMDVAGMLQKLDGVVEIIGDIKIAEKTLEEVSLPLRFTHHITMFHRDGFSL